MPATAKIIRPSQFVPPPRTPRRQSPRSNLNRIMRNQDRREKFQDQDTDVGRVAAMILESGMSTGEICRAVYEYSRHEWMPHYKTIDNLLEGKTRRPHNNTLKWIALTLGWRRVWQRIQ